MLKHGCILAALLLVGGCGDDSGDDNQNNNGSDGGEPIMCGNGVVEGAEQCDDGDQNSDTTPDACRSNCLPAHCGDGTADTGELCDDGFGNSDTEPNACRTDCSQPRCGDAINDTDYGEECDCGDGTVPVPSSCAGPNSDDPASLCSTDCHIQACGNGIKQIGEECDGSDLGTAVCTDFGFDSGELACSQDCTFDFSGCAGCGNGVVEVGEQCDDGNFNIHDGCPDGPDGTCQDATCGDGYTWTGVEECDDGNTVDWDGCTGCAISEFQVNTYTIDRQWRPTVGIAADGRFVVAWTSFGQDGSDDGVFGQRYDSTGSVDGSEFRVNTTAADVQMGPSVAMASDGRFVVAWHGFIQGNIWPSVIAQRYDALGNPVGSEFQVNTSTYAAWPPAAATAPDGRFVVAWGGAVDGMGQGVSAQRYDATGIPVGGEFLVNTYTSDDQQYPAAAMASDGSFVVVWQSNNQDGSGFGIYGQRYDTTGSPVGTEFQVNTYTVDHQEEPSVGMAADGRFVVVWEYSPDIFAQRFDATGSPVGSEFQVNTGMVNYAPPSVAMASDGRFVVVWEGPRIHGQRYDATGNPVGGEFQVNTYTADWQISSSVAMAPDGRFVVVWASWTQDGDVTGVFAQRYNANGEPRGVLPW